MTRLYNDPAEFVSEMVDGLAAAGRRWVRPVRGGVVRSGRTPAGQVALVVGGGSGHYPAFAGLVGPGLAHGAAMGNLFASPSTEQILSVARACQAGGGVLFSYGNYAGDVLNFDAAQEQLRAEGIACRTVTVTDDISSAPPTEVGKRRGIAGDLVVFKIAGAAAAAGADLEAVTAAARRANDRTRSIGVAFSGCSLPGADAPLFSVPAGRMAIGMGVHGEPGLAEAALPSASELADLLVARLLGERPDGSGDRVAVILNGLGSVKYEELFVVYRSVHARLAAAGLTAVDPEVGELVTSFDMAGVSLTLTWLDDELERLWRADADSPAFHKSTTDSVGQESAAAADDPSVDTRDFVVAVDAADADRGRFLAAMFDAVAARLAEEADALGRLDATAGDGDHGLGMQRGSRAAATAARAAANASAGASGVLAAAGAAWADIGGGTSGALWGVALRAAGDAVARPLADPAVTVASAVDAAVTAVSSAGGAVAGDKTMVDAMLPFRAALADALGRGDDLAAAWRNAADASHRAAEETADLLPHMGRARTHAERSLGTPDPGAVSFAVVVDAIARASEQTTHPIEDRP